MTAGRSIKNHSARAARGPHAVRRCTLNVLLFHRLTENPDGPFDVKPELLQGCLAALKDSDAVPVDAASAAGKTAARVPAVALTFDDGNRSDASSALPLLAAAGATATFFLITGRIGHSGFLTWSEVRELDAAGMEIGSHTHGHARLTTLEPAAVLDELTRSKALLEDRLGRAVNALSIPFGDVSGRVVRMAGYAGFTRIHTSRPGLNPWPLRPGAAIRRNALQAAHASEDLPGLLAPSLSRRLVWSMVYGAKRGLRLAGGDRWYLRLRALRRPRAARKRC